VGLRGFWSIICGVPIFLVLYFPSYQRGEGLEIWEGFPNGNELVVVLGSIVDEYVWQYGFILAITQFSPLWITMATTLQIPTSILWDCLLHDFKLSVFSILGGSLIIIAFFGMSYIDHKNSLKEDFEQGTFLQRERFKKRFRNFKNMFKFDMVAFDVGFSNCNIISQNDNADNSHENNNNNENVKTKFSLDLELANKKQLDIIKDNNFKRQINEQNEIYDDKFELNETNIKENNINDGTNSISTAVDSVSVSISMSSPDSKFNCSLSGESCEISSKEEETKSEESELSQENVVLGDDNVLDVSRKEDEDF